MSVPHRLAGARLVLATHNKGKLAELRSMLAPYAIEVVSAAELGLPEPEETGDTFVANALLKAEAAAKATGLPALGDDSGIAVDALDGQPGIHSARWAGESRDFGEAMRRLQARLDERNTPQDQRTARFVSVIALAWPDGKTETFEGIVEGMLTWPPRGDKGFGYDPMFVPEGHQKTFGEMSSEEKHGWNAGHPLSHRARAFALFKERIGR